MSLVTRTSVSSRRGSSGFRLRLLVHAGIGAAAIATVVLIIVSCGQPENGGGDYFPPERLARLGERAFREISGLVVSRQNPGIFWIHNDSGGAARVFGVGGDGETHVVLDVPGARNDDWEDIAIANAPAAGPDDATRKAESDAEGGAASSAGDGGAKREGADWLWIADTGNNDRTRKVVTLYGFPEPRVDLDSTRTPATLEARGIRAVSFRFPGRPRNCEALVVSRSGTEAFLFTKELPSCDVFRVGLEAGDGERIAEPLARWRFLSECTGAALTSDSSRLAVRSRTRILELVAPPGKDILDLLARPPEPRRISAPPEFQGEAISYSPEGDRLVTVSEGTMPWLYEIRRRPEPASSDPPRKRSEDEH